MKLIFRTEKLSHKMHKRRCDFFYLFILCPSCVKSSAPSPFPNNSLFKHLCGKSPTAWYSARLISGRAASE
jgi:hypothetical protein